MSLTEVRIGEEVWLTCLSHALTTETEEVMGLLLGDVVPSSRGGSTAVIWGASPQMRCERKKDRVEVNPELLAAASAQAEISFFRPPPVSSSVFGVFAAAWIALTVGFWGCWSLTLLAHVRTQAMFQLLDPGFVGLIFSCFSEDAQKVGKIQVIAFQSLDGTQNTQRAIVPVITNPVINPEPSWGSSDNSLALIEGIEQDTGDSRASNGSKGVRGVDYHSIIVFFPTGWSMFKSGAYFAQASKSSYAPPSDPSKWLNSLDILQPNDRVDICTNVFVNVVWGRSQDMDLYSPLDTNHSARLPIENAIVPFEPDNSAGPSVDQDGSDLSPSIQEALHRSTMDIRMLCFNMTVLVSNLQFVADSGAEYKRKEVPLKVFPTRHLLKLDTTLSSYCDMQRVLFEEEQSAYNQAMLQNICDGKMHPLTSMHHTSTYNASLCKLMEYCLTPAITVLEDRVKENELRLAMLVEEAKQLEAEQSTKTGSPRRAMPGGTTSGITSPRGQDKYPSGRQGGPISPSSSGRRKAP
uniref:BRCC36 C-terminal helical domain-containing protein n=1 Tax=Aegilops tauschii TaxID=37682 RepID=N1R0C9_AEGTA